METAFLLKFEYDNAFDVIIDMPLLEQPFRKAIFVETLEDILLVEVAENLNYLVNSVIQISFTDRLEVLFEHFI